LDLIRSFLPDGFDEISEGMFEYHGSATEARTKLIAAGLKAEVEKSIQIY
jgi:hypothetical protein